MAKKKKKGKGLKGACWKGYEAVGFKMKGRRRVPNCVPKKKKQGKTLYLSITNKNKTNDILIL